VDVELDTQEWNVFLETRRNGNFQVARNGWIADWMDPSTMLGLFTSNSGNNDGNYNSPAFDQHIADTYATNDQAARIASFHAAEQVMLGEDWAAAPVYFYKSNFMVIPELKDWYYFPLGYTFLHTAKVEK
jgi:oligopeptide transport system substrate-binding protein